MIVIVRLQLFAYFSVGFLVLRNIHLLNKNEKLIHDNNICEFWGKYTLPEAGRCWLNFCLAVGLTPHRVLWQCYFIVFFLKAFSRREQAVFFSNRDPNVLSKCFQHFRPGCACSSKPCNTTGGILQSGTVHAETWKSMQCHLHTWDCSLSVWT